MDQPDFITQIMQIAEAKEALRSARAEYHDAKSAHAEAKQILERTPEYAALQEAEDILDTARRAVEDAQLEWESATFSMRASDDYARRAANQGLKEAGSNIRVSGRDDDLPF
jgi:hypothetical protein